MVLIQLVRILRWSACCFKEHLCFCLGAEVLAITVRAKWIIAQVRRVRLCGGCRFAGLWCLWRRHFPGGLSGCRRLGGRHLVGCLSGCGLVRCGSDGCLLPRLGRYRLTGRGLLYQGLLRCGRCCVGDGLRGGAYVDYRLSCGGGLCLMGCFCSGADSLLGGGGGRHLLAERLASRDGLAGLRRSRSVSGTVNRSVDHAEACTEATGQA